MADRKVYGFNLERDVKSSLIDKIQENKKSGNFPPSASGSWVVNELIKKWVSGEVVDL